MLCNGLISRTRRRKAAELDKIIDSVPHFKLYDNWLASPSNRVALDQSELSTMADQYMQCRDLNLCVIACSLVE